MITLRPRPASITPKGAGSAPTGTSASTRTATRTTPSSATCACSTTTGSSRAPSGRCTRTATSRGSRMSRRASFEHADSRGNGGILPPGSVQRATLGSGMQHSEGNHSQTEPMRFIQLWIIPRERDLEPSVEQREFPEASRRGGLAAGPRPGSRLWRGRCAGEFRRRHGPPGREHLRDAARRRTVPDSPVPTRVHRLPVRRSRRCPSVGRGRPRWRPRRWWRGEARRRAGGHGRGRRHRRRAPPRRRPAPSIANAPETGAAYQLEPPGDSHHDRGQPSPAAASWVHVRLVVQTMALIRAAHRAPTWSGVGGYATWLEQLDNDQDVTTAVAAAARGPAR